MPDQPHVYEFEYVATAEVELHTPVPVLDDQGNLYDCTLFKRGVVYKTTDVQRMIRLVGTDFKIIEPIAEPVKEVAKPITPPSEPIGDVSAKDKLVATKTVGE